MDKTSNLQLPFMAPSQAQKHVTHNDALLALDALIQLSAISQSMTLPPSSLNEGDRFIVGANGTDEWLGKDNQIAAWQDGSWMFYMPQEGWLCWVEDENLLLVWNGNDWGSAGTGGIATTNPTSLVGVNATADLTNRLSVNSPATLLNHEGSDHQLKVNKNTETDTASLLFQTGFSGRAEMGLTGDENFHLKVSGDGNTFHDVIKIDQNTGLVSLPQRTAFAASDFPDTLAGQDIANYSHVIFNNGNSFNPISGKFTAPRSGIYMLFWAFLSLGDSASSVDLIVNNNLYIRIGREFQDNSWEGFSGSTLLFLNENDQAWLRTAFGIAHAGLQNGFRGCWLG